MNILVIDVGTSSMRGILFDVDGTCLLKRQVKYQPRHLSKVWIEQPPEEFYQALEALVKWAVVRAADEKLGIDAVSLTAQRSSVIAVDETGRPLMPAVMWQDSRNAELCKRLEKENETIFSRSGAGVNTVFSGGKMAWIREEKPDLYERVYKFVNIPEYLMYRMTGEFYTDYTYGSRSNLMDLRSREWDPLLLEIFGLDQEKLCSLKPPGSVVGTIAAGFAEKTGLRDGIPVISAGGDQQCAAVGQGVFQEGTLSIVTGSGAFLVSASEEVPEKLDQRLIYNCSAIRDHYILEANVLTCCSAFDWFCNNFYDGDSDYSRVNQDLTDLYMADQECLALPYFQGKGSSGWNAEAKALFANITLSTTRSELLKALVEGIFLEVHNNIEIFKQYVSISSANISGGLTSSEIINQMQADIYGLTLRRMENREASAAGALIVALLGLGADRTAAEAFGRITDRDQIAVYHANADKTEQYQKKRILMNELYQSIYREGDVKDEQNQ